MFRLASYRYNSRRIVITRVVSFYSYRYLRHAGRNNGYLFILFIFINLFIYKPIHSLYSLS